ncbi:MAG: HAD family phosphatase [Sphingomonas fennica]
MTRPAPPYPDAVIFDMDGLLLDSERLYRDAMHAVLARDGLSLPDDLFAALVGRPWVANRATLTAHYGPAFDCERHRAECFATYETLAAAGTPLRPGAAALLAWLAAEGMPMAVATSTGTTRARDKLGRAGIVDRFAVIVGADDVPRHKPDPAPYLHAAALLGVSPARCWALEDSPTGIRAAAAAGMATFMVPDLIAPTPETGRLCVATLASLADLRPILTAAASRLPSAGAPG